MTVAERLSAPAKLTLELRITGLRADGFHLIDAEMVTLSFGDELTITEGADGLTAEGPFADGVPLDDGNLVSRALRATGRAARIALDKRIPHGGGLGGGSADAAAVLRWAGWTGSTDELERAALLGADVPFCLVGGRARVRGIGEVVEPLPHRDRELTLVIPPLRVPTPAAYRAWDELGGPTAPGPNDLEPAALALVPELRRWRDRIGDLTGRSPVLAGSGATWFVHGRHDDALAALHDEGARVIATRTTPAQTDSVSDGRGGRSSD